MGLLPGRLLIGLLHPVNKGRLIAPVEKLGHSFAMRAREHKSLHRWFCRPHGASPEGVIGIIEQGDTKIACSGFRLAGRAEREDDEWQHIPPGTNP